MRGAWPNYPTLEDAKKARLEWLELHKKLAKERDARAAARRKP